MRLTVRVYPGSRTDRVGGRYGRSEPPVLVVRVTARAVDGQANLVGALRRAMATTGYSDLKEFQRSEVVVAPYQPH